MRTMPKRPIELLREEAVKKGVSILDVYSFKGVDVIRLKLGEKTVVAYSNRKLATLTSREEASKFIEGLLKEVESKR